MLTFAVIMLLVGVLLLTVEILIIPGFGLFGFTGLVVLAAGLGIIMSAPGISGTVAFFIALGLTLLVVLIVVSLIRRKRPQALILTEQLDAAAADDLGCLLEASGVALTPLRPAGTADLKGKRRTVVTEGEFIAKGTAITVIQVEGQRIVVKKA